MTETVPSQSSELLTLRLGDQEYALDIMCVREIRGWTRATPLPHGPAHMEGVINLRGTVLPVMNLTARLGLDHGEKPVRSVIVVVKFGDVMTGLLVDSVSDIITVAAEDIQTPPQTLATGATPIVSALTLLNDRMIRILDLSSVLTVPQSEVA